MTQLPLRIIPQMPEKSYNLYQRGDSTAVYYQ